MLRARHLWQQEVTVNGGKHGLASRCGQRGDGNALGEPPSGKGRLDRAGDGGSGPRPGIP